MNESRRVMKSRPLLRLALAGSLFLGACSGSEPEPAAGEPEVDLARGLFDPAAVYVVAKVGERGCQMVLADPATPEAPVGGLPCNIRELVVRPSDGRVVYEKTGDLAFFEPDPLSRRADGSWDYPGRVHLNDHSVDDSGCSDRAMLVGPVWAYPDGTVAYRCNHEEEERTLHVAGGEAIELRYEGRVLAVGTQDRVLTFEHRGGGLGRLRIDGPGRTADVRTEHRYAPYAARGDQEGFLAAFGFRGQDERPASQGELVRVRYHGATERVGRYGAWPEGYRGTGNYELAADGTLYAVATREQSRYKTEMKRGTLLRFRADGREVEVVLADDGTQPLRDLWLFTGSGGMHRVPGEAPRYPAQSSSRSTETGRFGSR